MLSKFAIRRLPRHAPPPPGARPPPQHRACTRAHPPQQATHLPRHLAPLRQPPPRHPLASSPPPPPRPPRAPKRLTALPSGPLYLLGGHEKKKKKMTRPQVTAMRNIAAHQSPPPWGAPTLWDTRQPLFHRVQDAICRAKNSQSSTSGSEDQKQVPQMCVKKRFKERAISCTGGSAGIVARSRACLPIFGLVRPVGAPERGRRRGRRCR